jgi:thiol-disulfide isomerase/thioredoxin
MALEESIELPIGTTTAPNFNLLGTDERRYTLSDFARAKGVVIVFTCNHCPYAEATWPAILDLAYNYRDKLIQFIAINPNDPAQNPEDSYEEMKFRAKQWRIPFPYLFDKTQVVARAYKAQCTPDTYLFDEERKLYYHGRVMDQRPKGSERDKDPETHFGPETVEKEMKDLELAIYKLLEGERPLEEQFPSIGCSIKWKIST